MSQCLDALIVFINLSVLFSAGKEEESGSCLNLRFKSRLLTPVILGFSDSYSLKCQVNFQGIAKSLSKTKLCVLDTDFDCPAYELKYLSCFLLPHLSLYQFSSSVSFYCPPSLYFMSFCLILHLINLPVTLHLVPPYSTT